VVFGAAAVVGVATVALTVAAVVAGAAVVATAGLAVVTGAAVVAGAAGATVVAGTGGLLLPHALRPATPAISKVATARRGTTVMEKSLSSSPLGIGRRHESKPGAPQTYRGAPEVSLPVRSSSGVFGSLPSRFDVFDSQAAAATEDAGSVANPSVEIVVQASRRNSVDEAPVGHLEVT
jgi:hypothetical protein